MTTAFRNIERARGELTKLQGELLELDKHMNSVRESLGNAITELFGKGLAASQEALLAASTWESKWRLCVRGDCFVRRMGLPSPVSGGW
jgi:hypothetical protein